MIKVRILNKQPYWQNYEYTAYENLKDFARANKLKVKSYKNGNEDIWFKKLDYRYGKYLIDEVKCSNVMVEVTGKV